MKRSKMIETIEKAIILFGNTPDTNALALFILTFQEDLGMLPPKNLHKYNPVPFVTPTGNLDYSYINEWESEDDKHLCPKHMIELKVGESALLSSDECEVCKNE